MTKFYFFAKFCDYHQMKEEKIKKKGTVIEALPSATFRVKLEDGKEAICYLSGKMRMYKIKILPGDQVLVEFSQYDEKRGRIIKREDVTKNQI